MTTGKNASIYRQDWSCLLCCNFVLTFQVSPLFITMDGVDFVNRLNDDSMHLVFDNFHAPTQFMPFGQGEKSFNPKSCSQLN